MSEQHPAHMPRVIGHRGACGHAPENTLASIDAAARLGAQAVEFDATVDADAVARVQHDFNVDRCTDGNGPIVLKTASALDALDAGGWFAPEFAGQRVPRLDDALARVLEHGLKLNLELKPTLGWEEPTARAVAETLQRTWPEGAPLLVSSMSTLALDTFHALMPDVTLGLITYAVPEHWLERLEQHHCNALHCYHAFVTETLADEVHVSGHRLHVYTVNDAVQARALFAMGVDAVFTDFPDRILPVAD